MKPLFERWEAPGFLVRLEGLWQDIEGLVKVEEEHPELIHHLVINRTRDIMDLLRQVATFTAHRRAFLVLALAERLKPTDPKAQREFWDTLAFEAEVRSQELEESHGCGESLAHRQWVRGPLGPQSP